MCTCETKTFSYQEGWRTEQSFSRKNGEDSASSSDLDLKRRRSTPVKKMITQNLKKRMSIFSRKDDDDEDEWYQRAMENRSRANDSIFVPLLKENARSLVNFTLVAGNHPALLKLPRALENVVKPRLEIRQFKSHTMDNIKVRRMCDELLSLEDPNYKMSDSNINKKFDDTTWLKTLSITRGNHVHGIRLSCNPEISIGGYFIISQMLSYIQSLLFLDVSQNNLTAAEARVLSLGLRLNCSVQELRMKDNRIGASGATSLSETLRVNKTLLVLDLRGNNIRGPGICMLADSMQDNMTLTDMDLRWNYTGESSDYVEAAIIDLNKFCERNLKSVEVIFERVCDIDCHAFHRLLKLIFSMRQLRNNQKHKIRSMPVRMEKRMVIIPTRRMGKTARTMSRRQEQRSSARGG
mmetsp:Transcript_36980/g.116066  ORF Transcript_36980/g.116066 Transcript_36980/m.116066 type:complete len:408 (+) Transcript_36980:325-1548(+)